MIAEGKTKIITSLPGMSTIGASQAKDVITKHNIHSEPMEGKAEPATRINCSVFELLDRHGIPTAYVGRDVDPTIHLVQISDMIPVEVVVHLKSTGSHGRRNIDIADGEVLEPWVVDFHYKTTGKKIGPQELPEDDPLMIYNIAERTWYLYHPGEPIADPICSLAHLSEEESQVLANQLDKSEKIALRATQILSGAWRWLDGDLWDIKYEFGLLRDKVVLADSVDFDSWRVWWHGLQLSKQPHRDGKPSSTSMSLLRITAALTDRFAEFEM